MKCKTCNTNEIDGRKTDICESCKEKAKQDTITFNEKEEKIRKEIRDIVELVCTEEFIQESLDKTMTTLLDQLIIDAATQDLISKNVFVLNENDRKLTDLSKAFVKGDELKGMTSGPSYVTYCIKHMIEKYQYKQRKAKA